MPIREVSSFSGLECSLDLEGMVEYSVEMQMEFLLN